MRSLFTITTALAIGIVCSTGFSQDETPTPAREGIDGASLSAVIEMLEQMQEREQVEAKPKKKKKNRAAITEEPEIQRSSLEVQRANMETAIRCQIMEELQRENLTEQYMRLKIEKELTEERERQESSELRELARERMEEYRSLGSGYLSPVPSAYLRASYATLPVRQTVSIPTSAILVRPVRVAPVRARLMTRPVVAVGCCN